MSTLFKRVSTIKSIEDDPRVDSIHSEDDWFSGDRAKSWWCNLKPGWHTRDYTTAIHETTVAEVATEINGGLLYCPNDDPTGEHAPMKIANKYKRK